MLQVLAMPFETRDRRFSSRGVTLKFDCHRTPRLGRPTRRTAEVSARFGLPRRSDTITILENASVPLAPGTIVLIVGPSGSGKSSILAEMEQRFPAGHAVQRIGFHPHTAIIDLIAPGKPLSYAAQWLTACGLGEARLWLRTFDSLSEGERFRARLARAIALQDAAPRAHGAAVTPSYVVDPAVAAAPSANDAAHEPGESTQRTITYDGDSEPTQGSLTPPGAFDPTRNSHRTSSRDNQPMLRDEHAIDPSPLLAPILCDEFAGALHRRAALAIAFNLRRLVTRWNLCVVLAAHHDDLIPDLQPDVILRLFAHGRAVVERRRVQPGRPFSLRRRLDIVEGSKRDYETFAAMHYRSAGELGFVDRVFLLRERSGGEILGIVVYCHASLELSLRNRATGGWFSRNPCRVNRHLRVLRRLVIHPEVRGCGLGQYLVRSTLPLPGTRFVECLAAMGEHNPVLERAGMTRIGQYEANPEREAALARIREMGVDPYAREFEEEVARRPGLRRLVAKVVHDWYAATTGGGESRVERQSPESLARTFRHLIASRPVYYLWRRPETNPTRSNLERLRIRRPENKRKLSRVRLASHRRPSRQTTPRAGRRRCDRHRPFK